MAICAAAFTAETYLLAHSGINGIYISFVFFSTLVLYGLPSFTETNFSSDHPERHKWISEHKKLLFVFSAIGIIVCGMLSFFFQFRFILSFVPIVLIALAYFFPQTHLRGITGLKAGIVALVWTGVTAFYPLLLLSDMEMNNLYEEKNVTILLLNFLFIFPLCVIYNVRDIEADRKAGVRTLPVIYGVRVTIAFCIMSLLAFSGLTFFSSFWNEVKASLITSGIISAVLILFASEKRAEYFYSFWIDGMILLQALLLWVVLRT
jgi:4-hydroxybenzoate polyprenyltransferase